MRVCYIVNPTAGHGRGQRAWEAITRASAAYEKPEVRFTTAKGEALRLARAAADAGFDCVVAVGGDGTLGEVAGGLLGTGASLGLVPAGTGNDFARTVAVPLDPAAAVEIIYRGTARPIDMVQVQGGPAFINIAGIGFDAEVAAWVNRHPKYLGGTIPYVLGLVSTLLRYNPAELELELDGTHLTRTSFLVALGNAQCYGGGMRVTPDAKVDDGWIDVCVAGEVRTREVFGLFPKLYKGAHVGHPKVEFYRARHVEVRARSQVAVHADGEVLGMVPLTVDLLPGSLTFRGPAAAPGFAAR